MVTMGRRALIAVVLAGVAPAAAQDGNDALLDRSRAVLADPQAWVDAGTASPAPAPDPATKAALQAIAGAPVASVAAPPSATPRRRCRLFVSQSMPAGELRAVLDLARSHPDLVVVLRGLLPEQTLGQLQRRLQALAGRSPGETGRPAIELDPPRFVADGVGVVPTLVCYDGEHELGRVAGRIDPDWLVREVAGGRGGDRGTLGEVLPIAEPDLMLVLQQRAAGWDLAALRRDAESRYWQRRETSPLPTATTARVRRIDPSFVVTETLVAPDGRRIATAGDTVNPLLRTPFGQRLVVFDATDPRQCAVVRGLLAGAGARRITLVTSRWEATRGLDGLAALSRSLGRPVFLLVPELIERFRLEHVPSVVEADGPHFVVTELLPGDER